MSLKIEGYSVDEVLQFLDEDLSQYLFTDEALILHIGTAKILGQVRHTEQRLTIELAHIEGGGEGVLPILWILANRYAENHALVEVEWILHALTCANPNMKLRRLLERRGFTVAMIDGIGEAYYLLVNLHNTGSVNFHTK